MESAVSFRNAQGHTLHGVLHMPEGEPGRKVPGVVWLSAGQKVRLGAWRMNVIVARRLARLGIPTLRFDFHGIGDSEGEHPHGQFVMDLYGFIQTGGFRDDALAAARFLVERAGVEKLVFAGLCGGAISGLFAGPSVKELYGHVLVDLPVTISSAARQRFLEENPVEMLRTDPDQAETVWILYLKKLADLHAWRRLLSGESDYRLLTEALRQKLRAQVDRVLPFAPALVRQGVDKVLKPLPPAVVPGDDPGATASGEVKNEMVLPAFRAALAAGQKVHFLNSSTYHPTFAAYFADPCLPKERSAWQGFDLEVVPNTNHIFSLEHSQKALFDAVERMVAAAAGGTIDLPRDPSRQTAAAE